MVSQIKQCRLCGHTELQTTLRLGDMALTGYFPFEVREKVLVAPLELVWCLGECGLVQLRHTVDADVLWSRHYGYMSSMNESMICHLREVVADINKIVTLKEGDIVVDVGSNDGTLLRQFDESILRVGVEPVGKFRECYPSNIKFVNAFFPSHKVRQAVGKGNVKVVTSIAMFYDVDNPLLFACYVHKLLAKGGVWVTEQSYLPTMLKNNSYDTICHEHKCYYCLKQMKYLADKVGFAIIDVSYNTTNGGSFRVTFQKV